MEAVREYLLSVTGAALLCAIFTALAGKSANAPVLRLICGVFLVFTVVRPVTGIDLTDLSWQVPRLREEGEHAVMEGVDYARQARDRIITEQLEAYILDKAADWDAEIQVRFTLSGDDPPVPEQVQVTGTWSGYAKSKLEGILEQDLGIPREKQEWKHAQNE